MSSAASGPPSLAAAAASGATFVPALDDEAELAARVFARAIPESKLPVGTKLGADGMEVTAALREAYSGHENLLHIRALHAPACYTVWDSLRLCVLRRVTDVRECEAVAEAYRPCDEDLRRRALARKLAREDERRRSLAARAKEAQLQAAAAGAAARAAGSSLQPPPTVR